MHMHGTYCANYKNPSLPNEQVKCGKFVSSCCLLAQPTSLMTDSIKSSVQRGYLCRFTGKFFLILPVPANYPLLFSDKQLRAHNTYGSNTDLPGEPVLCMISTTLIDVM